MARCACLCHQSLRAEQRAAVHAGHDLAAFEFAQEATRVARTTGGVEDTDVIEAAVACDLCRFKHCEALSTRPRRPRIVRTQADGWTGEDGG